MNLLQNKKNLMIALLCMLLVLSIGWVAALGGFGPEQNTTTSETTDTTTKVEKVSKTVSGKSIDEDKKDALAAAQNVLTLSAKSPTGETVEERVTKLDDSDTSVVDPSLPDTIRFAGEFETDIELQASTYQALITLTSYIAPEGDVAPISDDMWKNVYVDQELGIAYVPVSVFFGPGSAFSLEMVYTDGEWKLAPYTLLDIVRLSASLQQQNQVSTTMPSDN